MQYKTIWCTASLKVCTACIHTCLITIRYPVFVPPSPLLSFNWLIDWLVFNIQRAFFQLYSSAQGFTPVRPFVYPAFSFSQKFWKFYTLLNNNQVKLSQAIIPFMVPELCPLNNWKISILWFLCYNLSFPQPNTQVKYNFGCWVYFTWVMLMFTVIRSWVILCPMDIFFPFFSSKPKVKCNVG